MDIQNWIKKDQYEENTNSERFNVFTESADEKFVTFTVDPTHITFWFKYDVEVLHRSLA